MKKILPLILASALLTVLYGCNAVSIPKGSNAVLHFQYKTSKQTYNIEQELTKDEAATVAEIFNGKLRNSMITTGVPSCGSDPNISIQIGKTKYLIGLDGCGTVFIYGSVDYFEITDEESEIIHNIFEKYGGFFPCV